MVPATLGLQIAATDLRFVEVRAREEERIRAAAQVRKDSQGGSRLRGRLGAALDHRRQGRKSSPAAAGVCVDLVCPAGYVADLRTCNCRLVLGAS